MNKTLLLFLCSFIILNASKAQTINGSIMHDGIQRDYVLYVPTNYDSNISVPLILNFHGFGGSGAQQMANSTFRPIADTAGFIIVHPTGTPFNGFVNHWNVGGFTNGSTVDDIGFTAALIDSLSANYNINPTRVYSTGFSNGGFFSHRLACELPNRIAAIASVSGTFTPTMQANCSPSHPTPVLQIHGTTDPTVPYDGTTGNGGMASVDSVINYWVSTNNCDTTPTTTALPDINTNDGSTVERSVYAGGDAGVSVELLKIIGGTHRWPVPSNTNANQDINASLEIWKFFSKYANTAVSTKSIDKKNFKIYPNPTNDYLRVEIPTSEKVMYELKTITGQSVSSGKLTSGQSKISFSSLPTGFYVLLLDGQAFKIRKD